MPAPCEMWDTLQVTTTSLYYFQLSEVLGGWDLSPQRRPCTAMLGGEPLGLQQLSWGNHC